MINKGINSKRELYEHKFDEHTMTVTDIVIDYGACNALLVSASRDNTCKVLVSTSTNLYAFVNALI